MTHLSISKYMAFIFKTHYMRRIDPAVNPTAKKNANSVKSLGIELTIRLS